MWNLLKAHGDHARISSLRGLARSPKVRRISTFKQSEIFKNDEIINEEKDENHEEITKDSRVHESQMTKSAQADEVIPWYLRDNDLSSNLTEIKNITLPVIPENAPTSIESFLKTLSSDYGIENLELFDLTELDEDHDYNMTNQPANYIIIGTGKSEKHIYKAANELKLHIKHNYDAIPHVEGMVNSTQTPTARRRMLKRARKGPLATDNEYGKAPNSWIMCDTYVNNIFIHILTEQRRTELNLESLWCKTEDLEKYTRRNSKTIESDDIFIGIRRLHTMTPFAKLSLQKRMASNYSKAAENDKLQKIMRELKESDSTNSKTLNQLTRDFDAQYANSDYSIQNYNIKRDFYSAIHILDPSIISLNGASESILAKYNDLNLALDKSVDFQSERTEDCVHYMKLLIDSPEIKEKFQGKSSKVYSDLLFDNLSHFLVQLYKFTDQQISLSGHPDFIPLLWRLSIVDLQGAPYLGSKLIDKMIHQLESIPDFPADPSIEFADNRARDVLSLVEYFNKLSNLYSFSTTAFKELRLFTYGNSNNWDKFWNEWETSFQLFKNESDSYSPTELSIRNWVRVIVYLAARNNKIQVLYFLNNYWDTEHVGGSLVSDLTTNNFEFNSQEEKTAFIAAMKKMLRIINDNDSASPQTFSNVSTFVESL